MDHSMELIEKISSKIDNLKNAICDGIDAIFLKYADKFNEISDNIIVEDSELKKLSYKSVKDNERCSNDTKNEIETHSIPKQHSVEPEFINNMDNGFSMVTILEVRWYQACQTSPWYKKYRRKVKWKNQNCDDLH